MVDDGDDVTLNTMDRPWTNTESDVVEQSTTDLLDIDGTRLNAKYSSGDWVSWGDDTIGMVVEVMTEQFKWPTQDEPVKPEDDAMYFVARKSGGVKLFTADELSETEAPDVPDKADPEDITDSKSGDDNKENTRHNVSIPGVDDPGVGWDSYPPSWEKAEIPARLILLDAWASMGASWSGAYDTFSDTMSDRAARKLASSMKDEVLGTELWRGGWD